MKLLPDEVLLMRVLRVKMQAAIAMHKAGRLPESDLMMLNVQTDNSLRELAARASTRIR